MKKQLLSLLMVLSLLIGMFPVSALAAEPDPPEDAAVETVETPAPEESEPVDEPDPADEPEPAPTDEPSEPDEPSESNVEEPEPAEPEEETADLMATSGTCGDDLTWTLDDSGTLTISGTGAMTDWSSTSSIPWYSSRASITSVVIQSGVTSIGDRAFYYCTSLTSVTIPDSVTSIGWYAFYYCTGLTSVTIPDSVTSIGSSAFEDCTGLTSITIPDSVTSIDSWAFRDCTGLTSVTIPDSVTSIGESAFAGCTGLTSITIPDSVTSIGEGAFWDCTGLTSVTIPDSVTSIGESAFAGCTGLTSVTMPATATINSGAFSGCTAVTQVTLTGTGKMVDYTTGTPWAYTENQVQVIIEDGVTNIGECAFGNCTGLTSVTIPDSVTSIGSHAFHNCPGLSSVTIPDSVTSIGDYAFYGCTSLTSVTIPDSVTSISYEVFGHCTGLTSVTIGNSVTSIGIYAFRDCTGLTSVTIGNSVTSIGNCAFEGCTALTSITMPATATITHSTFSGCTAVTQVTLTGTGEMMNYSNSSSLRYYYTPWYISSDAGNQVQVIIEDGVTSIGNYAFYNCTGLTNVMIPDSVTRIGDYAFYGCTSLTSVTIPDSVTRIGNYAFSGCTSLTSVTIPDSVTSIHSAAFEGCTSLTSVTIPDSVTSIGYDAFYGCTGLTSAGPVGGGYCIEFGWTEKIPAYAFEGCTSLTSVTIGNSVTTIGNYAFEGCTSLTSVTIPDSVTSIGERAFEGCTSLTSVTIPDSVTSIGSYAFYGCTRLTDVYYGGNEEEWKAISIGSYNTPLANATIYYNSYVSGTSGPISIVGGGEVSGSGADVEIPRGKTNASAGTFTLQCTISGYSGTVSWTSSDPSVFQLVGDTSVAFTEGSTDITIIGHAAKLGKSVITIKASNGQSFTFTVKVTASVRYLSSWDESTGAVKFDTGLSSALTNYVYNYGELTGLAGQYVLASTELLSETTGGFETYQIVWIKPVTSALGTITAVSGSTVTIDGTEYPVNDIATCFVYTSTYGGYYAELSSLIGKEVVYHVYEGEIVSVMQPYEVTGKVSSWDGKDSVTIDTKEYPLSDLTTVSLRDSLDSLVGWRVIAKALHGVILDAEVQVGVIMQPATGETVDLWTQADSITCSLTFNSAIELGTGNIYLRDYETDEIVRTLQPDVDFYVGNDDDCTLCIFISVAPELGEGSVISCSSKLYFQVDADAVVMKDGSAFSGIQKENNWYFSTAFGLTYQADYLSFKNTVSSFFYNYHGQDGYPIASSEWKTKLEGIIGKAKFAVKSGLVWDGACFGMSAVTALKKMGLVDIMQYNDIAAPTLYNMAFPRDRTGAYGVRDLINYYYLLQDAGGYLLQGGDILYGNYWMSEEDFKSSLKEVVSKALTAAQDEKIYVMTFGWMEGKLSNEVHTIAVCSARKNDDGDYELLIQDPMNIGLSDNITIASDYSSMKYTDPDDGKEKNVVRVKLIDISNIPSDWLIGAPANAASLSESVSVADCDVISVVGYGNFTITNAEDKTLIYKDGYVSGTMNILMEDFVESGVENYAELVYYVEPSNSYTFSSEDSRSSCTVNGGDSYISVSAENAESISLDKETGVEVTGDNLTYDVYTTMSDGSNFFRLSGETDKSLSIALNDNGTADISADSLQGVSFESCYEDTSCVFDGQNGTAVVTTTESNGLALSGVEIQNGTEVSTNLEDDGNGGVIAKFHNNTTSSINCVVMVAQYDANGKFLTLETKSITLSASADYTMNFSETNVVYKMFVVDALNTAKPIGNTSTFTM